MTVTVRTLESERYHWVRICSMFPFVAGIFSAAVVWVGSSRYGAGLSPDGISYLAASRGLLARTGLSDYDGSPFAAWPPLFPCLISLVAFLVGDVHVAARCVNTVAAAATTYFTVLILLRTSASSRKVVCIAIVTACSFPLLKNGVMVWSEPLFTLLSLVACWVAVQYKSAMNKSAATTKYFWLLCLVCSLTVLTRYLGVALIATTMIFLVLSRTSVRVSAREVVLFGALSTLPLALWLLRNWMHTGSLTGPRESSRATLSELVVRIVDIGSSNLVPPGIGDIIPLLLQCVLGGALVVALLVIVRAHMHLDYGGASENKYKGHFYEVFSAIYLAVYLTTVSAGILSVGLEPLSVRYLSPVIPFGWIVIHRLVRCATGSGARLMQWGLCVLALLSIYSTSSVVLVWRDVGAGDYSVSAWEDSQLLAWLHENKVTGHVYSNSSDLIYQRTGQLFDRLPRREDVEEWGRNIDNSVTLIFFGRSFRRYLARREDFYQVCEVAPIVEFEDGGVYRCAVPR